MDMEAPLDAAPVPRPSELLVPASGSTPIDPRGRRTRTRRRLTAVAVGTLAVVLLAGCRPGFGHPPRPTAAPKPTVTAQPTVAPTPEPTDGSTPDPTDGPTPEPTPDGPPVQMTPVDAPACLPAGFAVSGIGDPADPTTVAWTGSGTRAVVLAPPADGDLCAWADEMVRLAVDGHLVATFVWGSSAPGSFDAAIDVLRLIGAQEVALLGAGEGGTWAAALAADLGATSVVALSPAATLDGADARAEVSAFDGPLHVVASQDDPVVPASDSALVAPGDDALTLVPGAAHGLALLDGEHGDAVQAVIDATLGSGFAPR